MSGWIKFWKDMPNDPRVLAAALKLSERYVLAERTPAGGRDLSSNALCNAWRNAVTGALATLWAYADEHIRDDDSLPLTSQTLDVVVGIEGFFDVMPREWIDELDDGTVVLPGYCEKNSLIAKRKRTIKSNARVTQWRRAKKPNGNAVTSLHVTQCNAAGDLDQDLRLRPSEKSKSKTRARDEDEEHAEWQSVASLYPPNPARADWIAAEHAARNLVFENLATWDDLRAGVSRYAALCRATNRLVLNPAKFFTDRDKPWAQPWPLPPTKADVRLAGNLSAADEFMRRTETQ